MDQEIKLDTLQHRSGRLVDDSQLIDEASRQNVTENNSYGSTDPRGLPPVDGGLHAWLFCLSAWAFETLIWGWNTTYGIFQNYYTSHPPFNKSSVASISVIGTISFGLQYMGIIVLIAVFQRYPEIIKRSMWIGLAVCVLSVLASSFATEVWHLIILQGFIFGTSATVLYAPVLIWLNEWFEEKRGLAGGLIFGGCGMGGFILPLVMEKLLDKVGFRWTLRIWALILAVACGVALLGVNPRIPITRPTMDRPREPWFPRDTKYLKNPLLFCMLGVNVFQSLGYFPVSLFIPTYTSSLSTATLSSTTVLALFNVSSVICYILFGRVCDIYPYPYVILASGCGSALAAFFLWGFASSLAWVFAFAAVLGGLSGGFSGIWTAAASEIGGSRNHVTSLAFGSFAAVKGVAAIIGPLIASALHDTSNQSKSLYGGFGFRKVELFVGAMAVATSLGGFCLTFYSNAKRKTQ